MPKKKKTISKVQEVTVELNKDVKVKEVSTKNKIKTVRLGDPEKGWIWVDILEE